MTRSEFREVIDGPIDDPSYSIVGVAFNTDADIARNIQAGLVKLAIVQLEDDRPHDRGNPNAFRLTSWVEAPVLDSTVGHALVVGLPEDLSSPDIITARYYAVDRVDHEVVKGPVTLRVERTANNASEALGAEGGAEPTDPEIPSAEQARMMEVLDRRELLLIKYMIAKAEVAAAEFTGQLDRDVFVALVSSNIDEVATMYPAPVGSEGKEAPSDAEHPCDDPAVQDAINTRLAETLAGDDGSKQTAMLHVIDGKAHLLEVSQQPWDERPQVRLVIQDAKPVAVAYDPNDPDNTSPFPCSPDKVLDILQNGSLLSPKRFKGEYDEAHAAQHGYEPDTLENLTD